MGEHLHEAEVLARTLGDQHRLGRIATFMVTHCQIRGDYNAFTCSDGHCTAFTSQLIVFMHNAG